MMAQPVIPLKGWPKRTQASKIRSGQTQQAQALLTHVLGRTGLKPEKREIGKRWFSYTQ